jgi:hypothetical protein
MSIYYNSGHTDNPKEYNAKIWDWRVKNLEQSVGCVGQLACEECGTINSGTCLCAGVFTCLKCNTENGKSRLDMFKNIKYIEPGNGITLYPVSNKEGTEV